MPALFRVDHTFVLTGRGLVVAGQFADDGKLRVGSRAILPTSGAETLVERVTGVGISHGTNPDGSLRHGIDLLLGELAKEEFDEVRAHLPAGTVIRVEDPVDVGTGRGPLETDASST